MSKQIPPPPTNLFFHPRNAIAATELASTAQFMDTFFGPDSDAARFAHLLVARNAERPGCVYRLHSINPTRAPGAEKYIAGLYATLDEKKTEDLGKVRAYFLDVDELFDGCSSPTDPAFCPGSSVRIRCYPTACMKKAIREIENEALLKEKVPWLHSEGRLPSVAAYGYFCHGDYPWEGEFWPCIFDLEVSSNLPTLGRFIREWNVPTPRMHGLRRVRAFTTLSLDLSRLLKGLHDAGLVHGNVSPWMFVFTGEKVRLRFLDTILPEGSSFRLDEQTDPGREPCMDPHLLAHPAFVQEGKNLVQATCVQDVFGLGLILFEAWASASVPDPKNPQDPRPPKNLRRFSTVPEYVRVCLANSLLVAGLSEQAPVFPPECDRAYRVEFAERSSAMRTLAKELELRKEPFPKHPGFGIKARTPRAPDAKDPGYLWHDTPSEVVMGLRGLLRIERHERMTVTAFHSSMMQLDEILRERREAMELGRMCP